MILKILRPLRSPARSARRRQSPYRDRSGAPRLRCARRVGRRPFSGRGSRRLPPLRSSRRRPRGEKSILSARSPICRRSPGPSTRTPSTSPSSTRSATPSASSIRFSMATAAGWSARGRACSSTTAARASVLTPGHPNRIGPRKRPLHTIVPGMAARNGRVFLTFGVMGGQYQAMGHAYFLARLFDHGLDLQSAMDLPRLFPLSGTNIVEMEERLRELHGAALEARGFEIGSRNGRLAAAGHRYRLARGNASRRLGSAQGRLRARLLTAAPPRKLPERAS